LRIRKKKPQEFCCLLQSSFCPENGKFCCLYCPDVEECEARCPVFENGFVKKCPLKMTEEKRLFYSLLRGLPKNFEELEDNYPTLYKKVKKLL